MRSGLLIGLFAALATSTPAPAVSAAETRIHAVSFQSASYAYVKPFYRWVAEVNRRCAGTLAITASGPETVPSALQWHALKTGSLDMYFGPANYYRGALPEADVLNLARNEPAEQRRNGGWALLNALHNERINAWYLTTFGAGIEFFVYTTKPIRNGRFDGLRLRSVPLYERFLRALGAETRYLPAPRIRAALESATIDGYGWPLWGAGLGWEKFAKFRYGPGFMSAASPLLVNLDRWKSFDDGQRACLTEMAKWAEAAWPRWREEENERQREMLRAKGVEYVDLGVGFARRAEEIYWGMIEQAHPEFARQARRLFGPGR